MVSFFFTPIYMFILIFIVSFGTKKGTLATYSGTWYTLFSDSLYLLARNPQGALLASTGLTKKYLYRFQHTALTSRTTIYLLFVF